MANVKILTAKNTQAGSASLPAQFSEPVRADLITRAVLSLQAAARQPYGGYGDAGMRHSARVSKRRKDYRGSYGHGISRVPRKVLSRRGIRMFWVGAIVAGTVGGRRAHPPKPYKDWEQKVNKTENRKAIRSALAATMDRSIVAARGHQLPEAFPFIVDDAFESLARTRDLEAALVELGFAAELERAGTRHIRAGKGKMRGRKYKSPVSFLFVVSKDGTALERAASNLPGSSVVAVHRLNAELLAPGTHAGRLTIYSHAALARLESEGLFTKAHKGASQPRASASAKATPAEKPAAAAKSAPKAPAKSAAAPKKAAAKVAA